MSEDGSCRASDTCALQGYVHCAVETDTQQGYQQRKLETNLGSYSVPTLFMSPSHDNYHAITPYLGNKGNLRLTHLQCLQYAWSRNQGRCCRFRHVCRESTNLQVQITVKGTQELWTLFSDTATLCTFINVFVTKSVTPWYAHPDSQIQNRTASKTVNCPFLCEPPHRHRRRACLHLRGALQDRGYVHDNAACEKNLRRQT